jgi:DNA-directed RNA polymerase specialized sigma24 family protein
MDNRSFQPMELARQRDFLCRLARGLLGDAGRAEDVVQEAFVLALERPPREERALAASRRRGREKRGWPGDLVLETAPSLTGRAVDRAGRGLAR